MKVKIVKIYDHGVLVVNEDKNIKDLIPIRELDTKWIDNIWDRFYEGQEIKVIKYEENGKIKYSRKKYLEEKIKNISNRIWENKEFDSYYQINYKVTIKQVIKNIKRGEYEVELKSGLIAILRNVPRSVININDYLLSNNKAIIKKIDKDHKKLYIEFFQNKVNEDIEEVEYEENGEFKLYINLEEHKDNLAKDLIAIQKNDKNFYPVYNFDEYNSDEIIDMVLGELLYENMEQDIFFSNTSLSDNELKITIRVDRSNRILNDIPKGKTLLLQGYIKFSNNPILIINRVIYQSDYPKKKFEIKLNCTIYFRPEDIKERNNNILTQNFINVLPMLSKIAKEKLQDWQKFLDWQKEYINKNIDGYKYIEFEKDDNNETITFYIVTEKEKLNRLKKLAKNNELAIYDNSASTETYEFKYDETYKNKLVMLGDFQDLIKLNRKIDANIKNVFNEPIIVTITFSLRDSEDELIEINKIQSEGFLATNIIGNLSQIKRQERALKNVITSNTYNPFLASWLFNIKNADLPKNIDIDLDYFNNNLNKDQKSAVRKMYNVPNIGLLQGPPGTGKTTVIAELIYQFTKDGKKVLLSSQSNLAVDNALDRLANVQSIRALRLGRANKISNEAKKFTEQQIVDNFYKNIIDNVNNRFLQKKEDIKKSLQKLQDIQSSFSNLQEKDLRYKKDLQELKNKELKLMSQIQSEQDKIKKIKTENDQIKRKKQGLDKVLKVLNKENDKENEDFYLDDFDFLKILHKDLKNIESYGISLYVDDILSSKDNKIFKKFINKISKLDTLFNEISKDINTSYISNMELDELQKQLNDIDNQIEREEDDNKLLYLTKEKKKIKNQIKKIKNIFINKTIYKELFSSDFYGELVQQSEQYQKQKLKQILDNIDISSIVDKLKQEIKRKIDKLETKTIDNLKNKMEKIQGIIKILKDKNNDQINKIVIKHNEQLSKIKMIIDTVNGKTLNRLKTQILTIKEDITKCNKNISIVNGRISNLLSDLKQQYNIDDFEEIKNHIDSLNDSLNKDLNDELINFLTEYNDRLKTYKISGEDREIILEKYIKNSNVVALTLNENMSILEKKDFTMFDVAIIDEVSKATPTELLSIMSLAKKVILVGDHRQLPPVWGYNEEKAFKEYLEEENEKILTKANYKKFEKMVNASLFKEYFEQADSSIKESLFTQYRMHTQIMDLINHFYEGKLKQGLENPNIERSHDISLKLPFEVISPNKHAVWLDTTYDFNNKFNKEDDSGYSRSNKLEVDVIHNILKKLNQTFIELGYNKNRRKEIGIIAFYGAQVGLLKRTIGGYKKLLNNFEALKVEINTVDKYQGKEKDIIIVSMTRNKKISSKFKKISSKTSFIAQFERINVAFSRAKELLMIVGAKEMFIDYEVKLPRMDKEGYIVKQVYRNIINQIKDNHCLYSLRELQGLNNDNR